MLCFALNEIIANAQQHDYRSLFGNDWNKANSFLDENNYWIKAELAKYNIPYDEAVAVIFPELVRYSALRDKMETGVLKALYVNLGKEYANFSIGAFQIKPSFAEIIRTESQKELGKTGKELFGKKQLVERELRSLIVNELENPEDEFRYIIAFHLLCYRKFKDLPSQEEFRVRFLSSAYNTGFWKDKVEIEKMCDKKFFSTKLITNEYYSYSDVAVFWFNNNVKP